MAFTTPLPIAAATDAGSTGTVVFALKPCPLAVDHPFTGGKITYQVSSGEGYIEKQFAWNSSDPKPLHLTLHVPPGVYTYSVNGEHISGNTGIACQTYLYFAVLPGDTRHINDQMLDCCGDPIPALFFAGIVPAATAVSLARFDGAAPCDASLAGLTRIPIDVERDAVGYYARDATLTSSPEEKGAIFGLEVRRPSGESRTIRIVADYPEEIVSVPPNLVRFDLTNELLTAAFNAPAGRLFCSKSV